MTTAIKVKLCLSATAAALACACSGPGNTGLNPPDETLVKEMPWLNGGVPVLDESGASPVILASNMPVYPPIGQNLADPGSLPVNCALLAPYTFAPWVETGEPQQVNQASLNFQPSMDGYNDSGTYTGLAIRWAGADDNTRGSWRTPGFATWYDGLVTGAGLLSGSVWGTPAQSVTDKGIVPDPALPPVSSPFPPGPVPACDGKPNGYVIHMRGEGFRYYGGNIAHILAGDNFTATPGTFDETDCPRNADNSLSDLCHPANDPNGTTDTAGFPVMPTKNASANMPGYQLGALHTYLDVSKYEGVSFWARRGPDSFGTLQVTLNDKYTSDDMNRQNEQFCRRIYGCYSQCQNGEPCSQTDAETDASGAPLFRCFDPRKGKIPSPDPTNVSAASDLVDEAYPRCNPTDPATKTHTHGSACTFRETYPDADFEGKECRPYTFTSGESGEYCFNANDPTPPSREDRCGDGFTSNLQLTGDWVFYTVPFSDMRQGGYGKKAPELDLKSVYSITLAWGGGNVDFYIDNVSFYRTNQAL